MAQPTWLNVPPCVMHMQVLNAAIYDKDGQTVYISTRRDRALNNRVAEAAPAGNASGECMGQAHGVAWGAWVAWGRDRDRWGEVRRGGEVQPGGQQRGQAGVCHMPDSHAHLSAVCRRSSSSHPRTAQGCACPHHHSGHCCQGLEPPRLCQGQEGLDKLASGSAAAGPARHFVELCSLAPPAPSTWALIWTLSTLLHFALCVFARYVPA